MHHGTDGFPPPVYQDTAQGQPAPASQQQHNDGGGWFEDDFMSGGV